MEISCSTLLFRLAQYPDIQDNLARIKDLGFTAVDVAAFDNWQNISPVRLAGDQDYFDSTVRKLKASGLEVTSINSRPSVEIIDPDDGQFAVYTKEFAKLLELAASVNCSCITIQPGSIGTTPLEESLALLERRAPVIGEMARKLCINVGMEGHQGSILENVPTGLALVKRLYPLVCVTYDPSHYVMQGFSLAETKPLLDYAVQAHFRNASYGNMQANMEDGEIDIAQFVGLLKEKNYTGSIAIEYFSGFDADCANTLDIKARLENLLK